MLNKMKNTSSIKIISKNKRAYQNYILYERIECGIVLLGTEVKSIKIHNIDISNSYVIVKNKELFLIGLKVLNSTYSTFFTHNVSRIRKLLAHKREINKIFIAISQKGYSLIPLQILIKNGLIKIIISIAKGQQKIDKRRVIKEKEIKRKLNVLERKNLKKNID